MAGVAVPRQVFADILSLTGSAAGTARAGMTGAEIRCGHKTMFELCPDAGQRGAAGAPARRTGGVDALPHTQHAIFGCPGPPKGRSSPRNAPEAGECRLIPFVTPTRQGRERMRRREFIALGAIVAVRPVQAVAQPKAKLPLVGILWHAGRVEEKKTILYRSMHQGFRDLGYVPGQNLIIEERFPGEIAGRFEQCAKELVDLNPDVLVAVSIPSILAVQKATSTLPVVFLPPADPVALKLVKSLAHPGGNMTGLSSMGVDVAAKRVQFVTEMLPRASSIALLCDPVVAYNLVEEIAKSKAAGARLNVKVTDFKVHKVEELEPAFAAIAEQSCQAIILEQGPMFFIQRARISKLAAKHGIPMMGPAEVFCVGSGFVMSYGASWPAIFRRAPVFVQKILRGAKPADLPVEQPTIFDLAVNLKAAKEFGIELPRLVLAQADRVIQ